MPKVVKESPKKQSKSGNATWDSIMGVDEFCEDEGIKVGLFGRSGTGKTTIWTTFPKPILAMICSGTRSGEVKHFRKVAGIDAKAIDDEEQVYDLYQGQLETGKYKTLVLDHASSYQEVVLKKVLGVAELPAQLGWGVATQQQWGQVASLFKERVGKLLSLSCNVVIIAQEREHKIPAC